MPSTHKRRLSDFLKPFAKSSTFDLETVEIKEFATPLVAAAGAVTAEAPIFIANGPVAVKEIIMVNNATIANNTTNYRNIVIKNKGADGTGTTELAAVNGNAASGNYCVAFMEKSLYAPAAELSLADGVALSLEAPAAGGTEPALNAIVVVRFISLMDA